MPARDRQCCCGRTFLAVYCVREQRRKIPPRVHADELEPQQIETDVAKELVLALHEVGLERVALEGAYYKGLTRVTKDQLTSSTPQSSGIGFAASRLGANQSRTYCSRNQRLRTIIQIIAEDPGTEPGLLPHPGSLRTRPRTTARAQKEPGHIRLRDSRILKSSRPERPYN